MNKTSTEYFGIRLLIANVLLNTVVGCIITLGAKVNVKKECQLNCERKKSIKLWHNAFYHLEFF